MKIIFLLWLALIPFFILPAADDPLVLIVYQSQTGHTRQMAEAVSAGARQVDSVRVRMIPVEKASEKDIRAARAIVLGCPVYNGAVPPAMQGFINSWPFEGQPLKNKIGAAFVSAGGISAGQESTMLQMLRSMLVFNMIIVGGEEWNSAFGAAAITGEAPFTGETVAPLFLDKARKLGRRVAALTRRLYGNDKP